MLRNNVICALVFLYGFGTFRLLFFPFAFSLFVVPLSTPNTIFAEVIMKRLSPTLDLKIGEEQAGFRRGRDRIDHIKQSTEWQCST